MPELRLWGHSLLVWTPGGRTAGCHGGLSGPWFFGSSRCALLSLWYSGTKSICNGGMDIEHPEFESCPGSRGLGQGLFDVD